MSVLGTYTPDVSIETVSQVVLIIPTAMVTILLGTTSISTGYSTVTDVSQPTVTAGGIVIEQAALTTKLLSTVTISARNTATCQVTTSSPI